MSAVDLSNWGEEVPQFIRLLAAEVSESDRTKAAARIGISRSAVTLLLANKYPSPSTKRVERRVMKALTEVKCKATGEMLTPEQCQAWYQLPAPTHKPHAMQHWRVCQQCPFNPNCSGGRNDSVH